MSAEPSPFHVGRAAPLPPPSKRCEEIAITTGDRCTRYARVRVTHAGERPQRLCGPHARVRMRQGWTGEAL